jgi:YYY domain-containing protein
VTDFLLWLLAIEALSVAFFPLTARIFSTLPDRGYIFSRVLGLLLVTYLLWLVGSVVSLPNTAVGIALVMLLAAALWVPWWTRSITAVRDIAGTIAVEEAIFLVVLAAWTLLRIHVFGSAIAHTEQFMDMALVNTAYHSASYPPTDPWMSGHTVNYYYFGYLAVANLCKLAGVAPSAGFTLANATLCALTASGTYSLGYALTRRRVWSLLAPIFSCFVGNWHAALWQSSHGIACGGSDVFWGSFWESTRVIGSGFTLANWRAGPPWTHLSPCANPNLTITEYPLFSFVLGDLHPHVMALPFALLALAFAAAIVFSAQHLIIPWRTASLLPLLLLAVAVGALFPTNSWDFPTYLAVVSGCIAVNAYIHDTRPDWWKAPLLAIVVLALLSVVLYLPFYLSIHAPTHGIGLVTTPTDLFEFIQVSGLFAMGATLLVLSLRALLQPIRERSSSETLAATAEAGKTTGGYSIAMVAMVAATALAGLAIIMHQVVLLLLVALAVAAIIALYRVLNAEELNRSDALGLVIVTVGCLVLALPEIVYLRDSFDGGTLYRMNTVFKFYYQGWILLGLATVYAAPRAWRVLRTLYSPVYGWAALALLTIGTIMAARYTIWVPQATVQASPPAVDGMAWLAQDHPDDYAGIRWLQSHISGQPVEVEAVSPQGGDYGYFARISTFTGLPTVMGWAGHEQQWGRDNAAIAARTADVKTMYTTASVQQARRLLRRYHARYVIVGSVERETYGTALQSGKFSRFMRVAFRSVGMTIYTW